MSRRLLRTLGPALLLGAGAAYALSSWNWCGRWEPGSARLLAHGSGQGALQAGAARVPLEPPWPIVPAGYPPPRPEAGFADPKLFARAVALQVGQVRVGLVQLDLLTLPPGLSERVREAVVGFDEVWVVASHSHSSMGGYDPRPVSQLAGTGRYRAAAGRAVERAAVLALETAALAKVEARIEMGEGDGSGLARPRTGEKVDARLLRIRLLGSGGEELAELWLTAAHPALESRRGPGLSPDFPGRVEREGGPITLVLQGAVGNAAAVVPEGEGPASMRFARVLAQRVNQIPTLPVQEQLAFARVEVNLPRPDASRLAPWFARAAGDNLLCRSAAPTAQVLALRLGELVLLGVPGEPSLAAAMELEEAAGGARAMALVDGYLGYLEPAEVVRGRKGEALRQYFAPELLEVLEAAGSLAAQSVR